MAERPSDPVVFGDWDPDEDGDGNQDDGSDGPHLVFSEWPPEDVVPRINEVLAAYDRVSAAAVTSAQDMEGLTRAFHAPGCEEPARADLAVRGVAYDELCASDLVPAGEVYVTREPDMETLELKFNDALARELSRPVSWYWTATAPAISPSFTRLIGPAC